MLNKKGFTLIELLVVILIIGILLALIIPNFALFQERARRSSVKNNMHVIQTALEAYATDHMGQYPSPDVAGVIGEDNPLIYYFPGGDPLNPDQPGHLPTNPYTGVRYNDDVAGTEDLYYGELYEFETPGQNAMKAGADSPYAEWVADDLGITYSGSILIGILPDEAGGAVLEYGIGGWGRLLPDVDNYPMYDVAPGADDPTNQDYWVFFVLHN